MFQEPNGKVSEKMPDTEVMAEAKRRQYTTEYKLCILRELDGSQDSGETGTLLRREGLYSSHLTNWRQQRERGEFDGLAPQKRGPKPDTQAVEMVRLQRENERLWECLRQAEIIIDVQKKLLRCSGFQSRKPNWTRACWQFLKILMFRSIRGYEQITARKRQPLFLCVLISQNTHSKLMINRSPF